MKLSMMRRALPALVWLAAQALVPAAAQGGAEAPPAECLAVLDTLAASIPKEESLVELKRKGVRLTVPLLPVGVAATAVSSGVVVRMKVEVDGRPVPGSAQIVKTQGDANLGPAVEAAAANVGFDLTGANGLSFPFTFSTAYVSCARK